MIAVTMHALGLPLAAPPRPTSASSGGGPGRGLWRALLGSVARVPMGAEGA